MSRPSEVAVVQEEEPKVSAVTRNAARATENESIVRVGSAAFYLTRKEIPGIGRFDRYAPLTKSEFEVMAYTKIGGVSRSAVSDAFQYVIRVAPDVSASLRYILLGQRVWDTVTLDFVRHVPENEVLWRSPYDVIEDDAPVPFVMQLAGGDEAHYRDIVQSIAAILMHKKPVGVIWWVGSGANGKSSLMDALYRIFPDQLASLTVKALTDERDAPRLNGALANVVKESSEGRIEDTKNYKSIGVHEDFPVHKFHSQDTEIIRGNIHHIFSANQIPSFNDKGHSALRRTFVIPFKERFDPDPTFEDRTFVPEMLGHLLWAVIKEARKIAERGYDYKFSPVTVSAKLEYDSEASNGQEFAKVLKDAGFVMFASFAPVRLMYEEWCRAQAYSELGTKNFRNALQEAGFVGNRQYRVKGNPQKVYALESADFKTLVEAGMPYNGMYRDMSYLPAVAKEEFEEEKEDPKENNRKEW